MIILKNINFLICYNNKYFFKKYNSLYGFHICHYFYLGRVYYLTYFKFILINRINFNIFKNSKKVLMLKNFNILKNKIKIKNINFIFNSVNFYNFYESKFESELVLKFEFTYNFYSLKNINIFFLIIVFIKNNIIFNKFYKISYKELIKYFTNFNDFFIKKKFYADFISNKYFFIFDNINFNNNFIVNKNNYYTNINNFKYNNYYPVIFFENKINFSFFKKFKNKNSLNYLNYMNKLIITFLEKLISKKIYIKVLNNSFYENYNYYLNSIINDYKFYKPSFFKNNNLYDFIKIIWYSFYFKDVSMISKWISVFMEGLNFKNHKKFLLFFSLFMKKHYLVFIDILKIKGFFFDIRGKVGVTGSSKKRHFCIVVGKINKFNKKTKIDLNQNLVRTYSGVMGVTYILNY